MPSDRVELAASAVYIRHVEESVLIEVHPTSTQLYRCGSHTVLRIVTSGNSETIDLIAPQFYLHNQRYSSQCNIVITTPSYAIEMHTGRCNDTLMSKLKAICLPQTAFRHIPGWYLDTCALGTSSII